MEFMVWSLFQKQNKNKIILTISDHGDACRRGHWDDGDGGGWWWMVVDGRDGGGMMWRGRQDEPDDVIFIT